MWGHRMDALASRFLQEIPAELITRHLGDHAASPLDYRDADGFTGRGTEFTEGRAFGTGAAPPVRSTGAEKLGLASASESCTTVSGRAS